jgi:tetratricopeptide (TPR) repeat protein
MLIQKSFLVFLLILASNGSAFSQNSPDAARRDALSNYRAGRDLESRERMSEADFFYNESVRICTDEISRTAAGRDTYTVLAWTLQRQRKYADVITWGDRGLRLYADEYRIVQTMGEAYFYLGDHDRSLRFMQRYANSAPQGERASVAYFFIGEIYRLRKQFRHADIAYSTAVRLEPGLALWWYRLGSVREAAGDFVQAIDAYERAIRLNPNYREAGDGLARSRRQAG